MRSSDVFSNASIRSKKNAGEAGLSESSHKRIAKARRVMPATAAELALLFQRSSSCVEGRNGHLALWHHSRHRLSPQRLQSLTVLANFFHRRPDGTTAAERFFGTAPSDVCEWLLAHVALPARPARSRLAT